MKPGCSKDIDDDSEVIEIPLQNYSKLEDDNERGTQKNSNLSCLSGLAAYGGDSSNSNEEDEGAGG